MSDEGERTCPLCAEEMDLTDQQLKPCKCGYKICVWCWHHIMDMAEKDDTDGRCPACRSPYDKDKIVGMAANCERLLAGVHMEKKMKNQKAKSKSYEGRKQLNDMRVIQRNLVYIVGLPLNLGDEDLLQRREYFGQYGKVLKVSMSRMAGGVVQQFPNNTCSVYITYSKEEEAIRCIQNVHGFVLDDRPLRACFGTTKYCHAWLRNMPCSNPDCLYLHEFGSQEDSFTKDEIISAYTRNRVQQITGAVNPMQQRSGNVLPPPLDDCTNNSSGKPIMKNASSQNSASVVTGSPPNGSSVRPIALPAAAWGARTTNFQPAAGRTLCPNGLSNPRPDTTSNAVPFSSAVAGKVQSSLQSDVTKRPLSSDESRSITPGVKNELLKPVKQNNSTDNLASGGEKTLTSDVSLASVNSINQLSPLSLARDSDSGNCATTKTTNSIDIAGQSCSFGPGEALIATNEDIHTLSSELSSVNIGRDDDNENYSLTKPSTPSPDSVLVISSQHQTSQFISDNAAVSTAISDNEFCNSKDQCEFRLGSQPQVVSGSVEVEDDVTSFDNERLKDPEVVCHSYLPNSSSFLHASNYSSTHLLQHGEPHAILNAGSLYVDDKVGDDSVLNASDILGNGYPEKLVSISSDGLPHDERNKQCDGRLVSKAVNTRRDGSVDKGESSIISNILSMEFDAWDDSLTSPQNLAKLLGDNSDNQNCTLKNSSSFKVQNSNQSRFSFARQEESKIHAFNVNPSYDASRQYPNSHALFQEFSERDVSMDKFGIANGFPAHNIEESEFLVNGHLLASSNKLSAVPRPQISAPPGFSVPSRPPPPGFSSHDRMGHAVDSFSGNPLLNPSSLLSNSYQTPSTGNIGGAGDIEFLDPAILAVGKGRVQGAFNSPVPDMRSNYPPQLNYFETEARLQSLMQRSLPPQQNLRFSDIGNTFSQLTDSSGISSRLDQSQVGNLASFPRLTLQQSRSAALSNGQFDGWNQVHSGNPLGVAELLRNERLGFNKFYSGYDDSKYRMPNSGDLYNRTYGI